MQRDRVAFTETRRVLVMKSVIESEIFDLTLSILFTKKKKKLLTADWGALQLRLLLVMMSGRCFAFASLTADWYLIRSSLYILHETCSLSFIYFLSAFQQSPLVKCVDSFSQGVCFSLAKGQTGKTFRRALLIQQCFSGQKRMQ